MYLIGEHGHIFVCLPVDVTSCIAQKYLKKNT